MVHVMCCICNCGIHYSITIYDRPSYFIVFYIISISIVVNSVAYLGFRCRISDIFLLGVTFEYEFTEFSVIFFQNFKGRGTRKRKKPQNTSLLTVILLNRVAFVYVMYINSSVST